MENSKNHRHGLAAAVLLACWVPATAAQEAGRIDRMSFAEGVVPIAVSGAGAELRVGLEEALQAIDGDPRGYGLTPKPGPAGTQVEFLFELPALTTFTDFSVPNVLETPSPSQTFVGRIEITGSAAGPDGPFERLGAIALEVHDEPGQWTEVPVEVARPVRWVRVILSGGIDVQREATFFEFSEIVGYGSQETVPLLEEFEGRWKGRGVLLELRQEGTRVSGCYDRDGELSGTVSGNILRATGRTRSAGIPSSFVLTVTDQGEITGVRSTNGAPFFLYQGASAPEADITCSEDDTPALGCGDVVHGIGFDYDSARIREESYEILDLLAQGLRSSPAPEVTIIGHTSSEGSEDYNDGLSQRRAEAVVEYLVGAGIERARLVARGRGEREPIADNATEAGRSLNRRVEIACR